MLVFKKLQGFALFETAISLIVVGSFAMTYQNQQHNKQLVTDALKFSKSSQVAVTKYFKANGVLPINNAQANLPDADTVSHPYISNLEIGEFGQIIITLAGKAGETKEQLISDKTIILEPIVEKGSLTWNCNSGSLEDQYRPDSCHKDNTNMIENYDSKEVLEFMSDRNYL